MTGKRVGLFIDGPNFHSSCRFLNISTDYGRLRQYFDPHIAVYVAATLPDDQPDPVVRLTDWLAYNGYRVITKHSKIIEGRPKGNMDIELALEMIQLAEHLDELVLLSGDGDFAPLVRFLQVRGKRVVAVSSLTHTGDELRRQVDEFISLETLRSHIARPEAANG